jgi:hypothetical protein
MCKPSRYTKFGRIDACESAHRERSVLGLEVVVEAGLQAGQADLKVGLYTTVPIQ